MKHTKAEKRKHFAPLQRYEDRSRAIFFMAGAMTVMLVNLVIELFKTS